MHVYAVSGLVAATMIKCVGGVAAFLRRCMFWYLQNGRTSVTDKFMFQDFITKSTVC
jgi:hypothetical protein